MTQDPERPDDAEAPQSGLHHEEEGRGAKGEDRQLGKEEREEGRDGGRATGEGAEDGEEGAGPREERASGKAASRDTSAQLAGRVDGLTAVTGLRVGHATLREGAALTGTTVVLGPPGGMTAAVDVRGGGPGTKETDALDPRNVVRRIDAIVLTGGSAYGLDAASGVMAWLEEQHRGVRVGPDPGHVVPVVPAACVFDLGRGGDFRVRPDASTGRAAVAAAAASPPGAPVEAGSVGAGTGAVVGGVKGGIGTASQVLESGVTVAALVVANAAGSAIDPQTGVLYGELLSGPVAHPTKEAHAAAQLRLAEARAVNSAPPLNTTLALVATDARLSRSQAQKLAGSSHDGIARAVRPVHLLNDGDTVFAVSTGTRELNEADPLALNEILAAGADMVTRAIVRAVRAAESVAGAGGVYPAYRELYGDEG